jgi:hypothetical protein
METGEEKAPEITADIESAVELRARLLKMSNFLKAHKSKIDQKQQLM